MERQESKELYLKCLNDLEKTIREGNIECFKTLCDSIYKMSQSEKPERLKDYIDNTHNPLKKTNLVILACKNNQLEILRFLFSCDSKVLNNLSIDIDRPPPLPQDQDGSNHNAFHHALCSNDVVILDTLINNWPGDYFVVHSEELEEILSTAYENLKVKNVLLSHQVEVFVEDKLIDLRFFSSGQAINVKASHENVKKRIELVLENIRLLNSQAEVNERFLFTLKFVVNNIHLLKKKLKSTYDRLPWEEIEFCLVCFICSYTKVQEINFFNLALMKTDKILNHLKNFAIKLKNETDHIIFMDIKSNISDFPKLKREKVVQEIIAKSPQFEELYYDYQQIRNIHSLERICNYLKLALTVNHEDREGQFVIIRALQVISHELQNTLEFPRISKSASNFLIVSLPEHTREIVIDLRNSLNLSCLFSKTVGEENADDNFFSSIQNDLEHFLTVITEMLYKYKIKMIRMCLIQIKSSEKLDEINNVTKALKYVKFDEVISDNFKTMEYKTVNTLIGEICNMVSEKTSSEVELFNNINSRIDYEKMKFENMKTERAKTLDSLQQLSIKICYSKINANNLKETKLLVEKILEGITLKIESQNIKIISDLLLEILSSLQSRMQYNTFQIIFMHSILDRLVLEHSYVADFMITGGQKILEFREDKGSFLEPKKKKTYTVSEDNLTLGLAKLKTLLNTHSLYDRTIENVTSYKSNLKLQAVIEIIVLEILSILISRKQCQENDVFLDDKCPVLIGKNLYDHLAHNAPICDLLISDHSIAVLLITKKLIEKNIVNNKVRKEDISKLKDRYDRGLAAIHNRQIMFSTLQEGNAEALKVYIRIEDICARNSSLWTALHFAVNGPSLEVVKLVCHEKCNVNAKDQNGQTPLHVAAGYGRESVVKLLVETGGASVDDRDITGKTALYIAAENGHDNIVDFLSNHGSDINTQDINGLTPVHIAASSGHKDVVQILFNSGAIYNCLDRFKRKPIDMTENKGINNLLTSIEKMFASNRRSSDAVKLVNAISCINVRNSDFETVLHIAACNGSEPVVHALLTKKADPNVVGKDGFTPLHYAAKYSHLKIVQALLLKGAIYNAVSYSSKTPLDLATDKSITNLFKIVHASFDKIKNGNCKVIDDIENITDLATVKAVMNAHNSGNKSLVVVAIDSNFPKTQELKEILQGDSYCNNAMIALLIAKEQFQDALKIHRSMLQKRKQILGEDNVANLSIQIEMANMLYKLHKYEESLNIYEEVYRKQKEIFGVNHRQSLQTKASMALVIHRQAKNDEALDMFKDVYQRQVETLGADHEDILTTLTHMSLVLDVQKKSDEALAINYEILEKRKKKFHSKHPMILALQNNIAFMLNNQGRYEESLKLYEDVYAKRKEVLGEHHSDTLRTFHNLISVLSTLKRDDAALSRFMLLFNAQRSALGPDHFDTLTTQTNIANFFLTKGNHIAALKNYKESFNQRRAYLGPNHPHILDTVKKMELTNLMLLVQGINPTAALENLYKDLCVAAGSADIKTVEELIDSGSDVNKKDKHGRTGLHYAIDNGHVDMVNLLLKKGADPTLASKKGNTALHTAAARSCKEIVNTLLHHVSREELNSFVNAKTSIRGTTSLHVAALNGKLDIVKTLLEHGAVYDFKNYDSKTPLLVARDDGVIHFLKLIEELYDLAKHGNSKIIIRLEATKPDEFLALTNTRNIRGKGLMQVLLVNKHKDLADQLLQMLKKHEQPLKDKEDMLSRVTT